MQGPNPTPTNTPGKTYSVGQWIIGALFGLLALAINVYIWLK